MKHNLKKIVSVSLISFLSGCVTIKPIRDVEQCSPQIIVVDGTVNLEESACLCRLYEHNSDRIGALPGTEFERPLQYCDKVIGYSPEDYGEVVKFKEEMRKAIEEVNNRSKDR